MAIQLGVQIVNEEDQLAFGFDLLDPTKIIPEELVPVTPLGKMQLNRNPLDFFAETEQVMVIHHILPFLPMHQLTCAVPTRTYSSRH